jgi:outer membrane protein assembly factor BamB
MKQPGVAVILVAATAIMPARAASGQDSVLTYHGSSDRSGSFIVPRLTWQSARSVRPDPNFHGRIRGNLYAQPLYWRPDTSEQVNGKTAGALLVATEDNNVQALDALTGDEIWSRSLGRPVSRSALGCGNINPLGVTGTPVIDATTESIFLDAAIADSSGPHHRVFALSLKDGSVLPGWPIDVADALRASHQVFNARDQNQRGALTILNGTLYVPFGGHFGDCGNYRGWVVGVSLRDPHPVSSWSTRARGGGIWAPGALSVPGDQLFAATGNTFGASTWSDGEAIIRLAPDLHRSADKRDFFAPSDWRALDDRDADLGGSNPIPIDVEGPNGRQALMLALGKDGRAYLLDRNNLGGIGGALVVEALTQRPIRTAPAVYAVGGDAFVALHAQGARCPSRSPDGGSGSELVVLRIGAGSPPHLSTAWCGGVRGAGSPIVTTSDGHSDPIVWMVGAEGDNRLHAFRGDTGEPLGASQALTGLRHFQTLIAAGDRLYVGADGRIYAFAF